MEKKLKKKINDKPNTITEKSSQKNSVLELYQEIEKALEAKPLTYNKLLEAVPNLKQYPKPLNSLWGIVDRYGIKTGKIEKTNDKPLKLRLKPKPK